MEIKAYNYLPEEARTIRQAVFVDEQGFKEEFDSIDNTAVHAIAFIDGEPAATGRVFSEGADGTYVIGRLAVAKNARKTGVGSEVLKFLENEAKKLGAKRFELHAQMQAKPFYEKNGYKAEGDVFLDQFSPHILMVKSL